MTTRDDPLDRLIGLEFARFGAAFAVLIWHYHQFFVAGLADTPQTLEQQPFHALLAPFYLYGSWSVHLFWCISGFIFAWKYGPSIAAGEISLTRFTVLRLSRLWPLQAATLCTVAVSQAIYFDRHGAFFNFPCNDMKHFLLNLGFASRWGLENGLSFNGPAWSVSAEVPVYFLFFFACVLIGQRTLAALPIEVAILVGAAVMRAKLAPQSAILVAAFFFYLGVLACRLFGAIHRMPPAWRITATWFVCAVACAPLVLVSAGALRINVAIVFIAPLLVLALQHGVPDRHPIVRRSATFLGALTYASYLSQFPLQLAVILVAEQIGIDIRTLAARPMFFLSWIVMVGIVSWLVFHFFEMPAQRLARRLLVGGQLRRGMTPREA
jgi:peptidoglycan/LPS O-acetylase OafA/YrhL